jgi:hypothetical protein
MTSCFDKDPVADRFVNVRFVMRITTIMICFVGGLMILGGWGVSRIMTIVEIQYRNHGGQLFRAFSAKEQKNYRAVQTLGSAGRVVMLCGILVIMFGSTLLIFPNFALESTIRILLCFSPGVFHSCTSPPGQPTIEGYR